MSIQFPVCCVLGENCHFQQPALDLFHIQSLFTKKAKPQDLSPSASKEQYVMFCTPLETYHFISVCKNGPNLSSCAKQNKKDWMPWGSSSRLLCTSLDHILYEIWFLSPPDPWPLTPWWSLAFLTWCVAISFKGMHPYSLDWGTHKSQSSF